MASIENLTRNVLGAAIMAAAIAATAFGAGATANAAPDAPTGYSVYTCYDYATQVFYDCY